MPWLRHHYYCETCDGTWFAEAEVAIEAECKFCGARDVFPYRSDAGRVGRVRPAGGATTGKSVRKAPARAGKHKRSA